MCYIDSLCITASRNYLLTVTTLRTSLFFFFQAEDGIRDIGVTGVQTCALPILVTPRARPRGMMVTLCTGSVRGNSLATTAWPDSWYAVLRRSCSGITMDLRSAQIGRASCRERV